MSIAGCQRPITELSAGTCDVRRTVGPLVNQALHESPFKPGEIGQACSRPSSTSSA